MLIFLWDTMWVYWSESLCKLYTITDSLEIVDEKFQEFLNADLEWHVPKRMKKHHQIEPDVALVNNMM